MMGQCYTISRGIGRRFDDMIQARSIQPIINPVKRFRFPAALFDTNYRSLVDQVSE